ncbi:delta(12)-fatty-acid desaturase [Plakobranchus ocellatus]|uniref:Delta(12)-fatty-acid desaturase n=1 Tax=Plakobranchus ocellatus TaxID=259542 RepID=A0AAV4CVC9_9GAST|nr:delta(12)-fatty-acid desaturase [Plakobranchus ocellatus]
MEASATSENHQAVASNRGHRSSRGLSWLMLLGQFLHLFHTPTDSDMKNEANQKNQGSSTDAVKLSKDELLAKHNLPRELPSLVEIRKVIPKHCFQPITSLSIYYMCKDFFLAVCLFLLCEWTWQVLPISAQVVITPLFWFLQGTVFTAIFVLGHDAGHSLFSSVELVNTICGTICHTFLLCPYYMWKLTHRGHHKHTNNLDRDEAFFPVRKSQDPKVRVQIPGFGLGIGWFVFFIQGYRPRGTEHYNVLDPRFRGHVVQCSISLASLIVWCLILNAARQSYGLGFVLYHHTVPCFIYGSYMLIITFLQHVEEDVPWLSDQVWGEVQGRLCAVDRSYGWCHSILHNMSTHQIHHLFPKIPHYYLEEATAHFRKNFPSLVRIKHDRVLAAFWRMYWRYRKQNIVDDEEDIFYYNK